MSLTYTAYHFDPSRPAMRAQVRTTFGARVIRARADQDPLWNQRRLQSFAGAVAHGLLPNFVGDGA